MNELRKQIFGIFDYCGDIQKNGDNIRSAQYSSGYSPNNIRAVVISAEGILIRLHKPYKGSLFKGISRIGGKVLYMYFNPLKLYKQDENGKIDFGVSFYKMLVRPLVCASIEEIVILQGVSNNSFYPCVDLMNTYDLRKEDLLLGYKRTSDQNVDIAERFCRLNKITTVNMSFVSFIANYRKNIKAVENAIFLSDLLKNYIVNSESFNDDWWAGIKLQPSTYALDEELKTYFEGINAKYEKLTKDEKVRDAKEKFYKKDVEGLDFAIKKYVSLCTLPMKLRAIISNGESNGLIDNLSYPMLQFDKVVDYPGFPKGVRPMFIDKESKMSVKEAIKHNKSVTSSISSIVTLTSKAFIENLYYLYKNSPITLSVVSSKIKESIRGTDVSIIVPSDCEQMLKEMESNLNGLKFGCDGKRMTQSIVNAVWLFSLCFIDNNSNTSKFNNIATWQDMIAKKGDMA